MLLAYAIIISVGFCILSVMYISAAFETGRIEKQLENEKQSNRELQGCLSAKCQGIHEALSNVDWHMPQQRDSALAKVNSMTKGWRLQGDKSAL